MASIPVCIAAKCPGVNSIAAEDVLSQLAVHGRESHFNDATLKHTRQLPYYSKMAANVPHDTSSPEAEKSVGRSVGS